MNIQARAAFWDAMKGEIEHAYKKHGRGLWGRHEFWGVLMEEVDEVWEAIKNDDPTEALLHEVVQVAAMCLRYAETADRYRGEHPPIPTRSTI